MATLLLLAFLLWAFVEAPVLSWSLHPTCFEWSALWTSSLIHHDLEHLLSNCAAITMTGIYFERRYGSALFVLFIMCASGISVGTEYLHDPWFNGHIQGASGVAFALIGALAAESLLMQIGFLTVVVFPFFFPPSELIALHSHLSGYAFGLFWGFGSRLFHALSERTESSPAPTVSSTPRSVSNP